jgi:hypothetical protein
VNRILARSGKAFIPSHCVLKYKKMELIVLIIYTNLMAVAGRHKVLWDKLGRKKERNGERDFYSFT